MNTKLHADRFQCPSDQLLHDGMVFDFLGNADFYAKRPTNIGSELERHDSGSGGIEIDGVRQFNVAVRQPVRVMNGQKNVDLIVNIRPFRVMIGLSAKNATRIMNANACAKSAKR